MSKPKYALKTTQIIYAVWLEIDAVWLGTYGVSVSHFFGGGFSRWTHELCVLHAAKGSSTPVELTESHSTQNIKICWNHPKSKNFRLIKKAPFEGWALQKLTFPHFSTKHDYCCLGCSRYVKPSSRRSPVHVSPTSCSKVLRRRLFFTFRSANQALNSSVHFLPTTFPDRAAELRKQRPILRRPQEPHYPKKRRVLHPRVVSPVNLRASERLHFPTT